MVRTRLAFSLVSGFALLSATGCKTGPGGPVTAAPTAYDLQIDASTDQNLGLLIVVSPPGTARPAPRGSVINVHGSLTYTPGPPPAGMPTLAPPWTCSGPWASFDCTITLSAPLRDDEGGHIPWTPPPSGTSVSYSVAVSMANNINPPSNHASYSFTFIQP